MGRKNGSKNINKEYFESNSKEESDSTSLLKYENKNLINLFDKNVESVLCKNYFSPHTGNENINNFEELMNKKENLECHYLHLIFPIKKNENSEKILTNRILQNEDRREYYEIGCKIFEINKIIK